MAQNQCDQVTCIANCSQVCTPQTVADTLEVTSQITVSLMKFFSYLLMSSALTIAGCGGGGDTATTPASGNPANGIPAGTAGIPVITTTPTLTTQSAPGTAASSTGPVAVTASNSCNIPNFQADMLRAVNEARAQGRVCGKLAKPPVPAVAAVAWDNELFAAAVGHSQDMAQREYFAHISLDGRNPGDRVKAAGYIYSNLGENLAAGQIGIAAAMKGWLESETGHCEAIMNGTFTEVAVACVTTARQRYPTYWTMELGKPG